MIGQDEIFTDLQNKNVSNLHTSFQAYSLLNLYKKNYYFLNKNKLKGLVLPPNNAYVNIATCCEDPSKNPPSIIFLLKRSRDSPQDMT